MPRELWPRSVRRGPAGRLTVIVYKLCSCLPPSDLSHAVPRPCATSTRRGRSSGDDGDGDNGVDGRRHGVRETAANLRYGGTSSSARQRRRSTLARSRASRQAVGSPRRRRSPAQPHSSHALERINLRPIQSCHRHLPAADAATGRLTSASRRRATRML